MVKKDEIRQARIKAGLTQKYAARIVYKSLRTWRRWECGESNMDLAIFKYFLIKTEKDEKTKDQV